MCFQREAAEVHRQFISCHSCATTLQQTETSDWFLAPCSTSENTWCFRNLFVSTTVRTTQFSEWYILEWMVSLIYRFLFVSLPNYLKDLQYIPECTGWHTFTLDCFYHKFVVLCHALHHLHLPLNWFGSCSLMYYTITVWIILIQPVKYLDTTC